MLGNFSIPELNLSGSHFQGLKQDGAYPHYDIQIRHRHEENFPNWIVVEDLWNGFHDSRIQPVKCV